MSAITVIRGDDITFETTIQDGNGNAIDITGYTVYFTVKKLEDINDANDDNALIAIDQSSHTDPENGQTTISLSNEDTNLELGDYVYDIQCKDSSGKIRSSRQDTFSIILDVTRRTS